MKVSLTPELERFVKQQLDTGCYDTASEVVREGLRLLLARQQMIESLDGKIDRGLADVAEGRTYSPEEAKALLRERRKQRERALS